MSATDTAKDARVSASPAMILDWIDELRKSVREAAWSDLLDFDGVEAVDVLLSPIYLAVLNTVRSGLPKPIPRTKALIEGVRNWGYQIKTALRDRVASWESAPVSRCDVLLWTRDITHTVILHPVAQAIRERGARCRLMACQPNPFAGLRLRDPSAVYTRAAWPQAVRQAHKAGLERARKLAAVGSWKLPEFPQPVSGIEQAVRDAVIKCLPLVSEAVVNAGRALDSFEAKVLVVGNDLTLEGRTACRVAQSRGVPTSMFMHGSITGDPMQARHCADRILVYGSVHRQELVRQGIAPGRVVVCGAPNLDNRPRQSNQIHPLLQARLGLSPSDPWILVATSGPGHRISHRHHATVIQAMVELSLAMPEVPVVVKLHRKDRLEYYQQGLQDCAAARLVIVAEDAHGFPRDIFQWLHGCRVVLTGASAVAVEAMLMEVPVVTMDFCNEIRGVDFIDAGATSHIRSTPELIETVREILSARQQPGETQRHVDEYLQKSFCALDGRSASRSAESLLELIPASSRK